MANHSVTFNGKTITKPGIYSSIESSMTYSKQDSNSQVIALIGESTGGKPDTVHFFSNPSEAKKVLKSGELLKACQKAWNPVSKTKDGLSLGGADIIACIRSNRATRAQKIVYAAEAAEAKIDEVVQKVSEETTGTVAVSGTFTGEKAVTYVIEITSSGEIKNGQESDTTVTFNYHTAVDEKPISSSDISAKTNFVIPDAGITVAFTAGTYTTGDQFIIGCIPAVTESTPLFAFVSKDYGKDNNKIQVKIEDGTELGSKKLTVFDVKSDKYEVFDNLGFAFTISYTGTENYAELNITTDGNGRAVKLQTKIGADKQNAIVDLDIDLDKSAFKSIRALVRHIQAYENYKVTYSPYCNTFCSVNDLDKITADIKGKSVTVTQMLADIKTQLDNDSSFITIEVYNKEVATVRNLSYTALSGGSEGKVPASWVDYFDMLSRYDIRYIVPLTSDDYIMAECQEHVKEMSETFGLERRAIFGTDNGKTVSEACTIARNLSNGRVQLVYPGIYDLDDNGDTVLYPGYILAAAFAGRVSALPDGESATQDVFRMAGIEKELDPVNDIPQLLAAGVVTFEFKISTNSVDDSYVQCVQDITTSHDDDILQVERAVGITADNINRAIRKALSGLTIGRKTITGGLTTVYNTVVSILENKRDKEEVIVAFKDVNVYSKGQTIYVEYAAAPAQPNNFTLVTGHFYSEDLLLADTEENGEE